MTDGDQLLEELSEEKQRLIKKFKLVPKRIDNKIYWVRCFANRPDHPYATHRALRRCHILELVFSFYDLCVAKMTYFRQNLHLYTPCKLNYRSGELYPCDLWDMEFLRMNSSGISIDLRNLAEISEIEVFRSMCQWLENQQRPAVRKLHPVVSGHHPNTQKPWAQALNHH